MNKINSHFRRLYIGEIIGMVLLTLCLKTNAAEIEGVKFADSFLLHDTQLILKGFGLLRYKIVLKGYVGGLYLPSDVAQKDALKDVPKRLELRYFWDIAAEKFGKAAAPYLEANVNPKILAKIKERIDRINSLYLDVRKGDRYSLTYHPKKGLELALNNKVLGIIEGADFAKAYFSIWLGPFPLNKEFKNQLLSH